MGFLGHLAIGETFNLSLTMTIVLIAVSQFNFGFDQQGFNNTQAMDAFERQFGTWDDKKQSYQLESWWLSLFTSLPYIGFGSGILIGSVVSNHFGRRMCMFTMSVWSLIATTIIITSKKREQILAARVLAYIYVGMELAVVPIYQAEITPRRARGFIVGTYQLALGVGGLVVSGVARGTSSMQSPSAYLIIFGLFYIVPTIVVIAIWFVPESPRWLALKGRNEEALQALRRLRQGKFTEEQIIEEMDHIQSGIEREVQRGAFIDMFRGKQVAKRTLIVIAVNIFLHATGPLFSSIYGAYFVKQVGVVNPFTISTINSASQIIAVLISMALVDNLGRRNVIFIGATLQGSAFLVMGGLGVIKNPSYSIKAAMVAMLPIMSLGFGIGWGPISHTISAEVPSMHLKDITYRTASVINIVMQFTVAFSLPYLLNEPYAALGSKVGFIFAGGVVFSLIFVYWGLPECKGRTLEEIDLLFESGVPMRHFSKTKLEDLDTSFGGKIARKDSSQGIEVHVEERV
ncbi:hypothetical protein FDECE_1639 [Fusarium decemcellulare]|nr:hypothetical protein FDECE_1639 [Fusarium decemcellulare]